MTTNAGLDRDALDMMLNSLDEFIAEALPHERLLEFDHEDVCPEETVRAMCGEDLGVQLVFIPEEYGGMGGGAFDVYRVCERHGPRSTSASPPRVLATFLGSDPILRRRRPPSRSKDWLGRIAEEGMLFAYGATEPEAGQRPRRADDHRRPGRGRRPGHRLPDHRPQAVDQQRRRRRRSTRSWPSRPAARRWFIVEQGTAGLHARRSRRTSTASGCRNTAALFLDDVVRAGGEPRRRRRGPGARPGPAGLRLHPADGRRVRPGRRLGGAGPRDRRTPTQAHPGRRPAVARSRATPTS